MSVVSARREELEQLVTRALASVQDGRITDCAESESLDFKEEAGRRTRTGELEPGEAENPEAATKLADEVACFANTAGGGVLLLGIEDKTLEVLGTELDIEWLRHRIYRAVDVAPEIVEHHAGGQRLLALYVAEAIEPVENTNGALRWRVGDRCESVDRAQWWAQKRRMQGVDPMAEPTSKTVDDVRPQTLARVRRLLDADPTESDRALLHRVGAVDAHGRLSLAAQVLLVPPGRVLLDMTVLDVEGGAVLNRVVPDAQMSLLEQVGLVEQACDVIDTQVTLAAGFAHEQVRRVPMSAVREAILNGVTHRDWDTSQPTEVRWVEADSTLTVRSPGGFTGGVTEANVLTHRHPRHPALADLCRALGLVEKQGLGIDRMYTAMISLGHRPPRVVELPGPYVLCELVGGRPDESVLSLVRQVRPEARQRDVRIVVLIDALLHRPFLTDTMVGEVLQTDTLSARSAMDAARQTTVAGESLVQRYRDVWVFGPGAFAKAKAARDVDRAVPVMAHAGSDGVSAAVDQWLACHDFVTSGDLMGITGVSRATAQRALVDRQGTDLRREGEGRSTRYLRL